MTLALRVFTWFRAPVVRSSEVGPPDVLLQNGDFSQAGATLFFSVANQGPGAGQAIADYHDVYRLHWQCMEQVHWSYGTGEKFSITNLATKYFPDGGGLWGDLGGVSDTIHLENGHPSHTSLLRLARAVLLPPRQNVKCVADISALPDGGNAAVAGTVQNGRNMLSFTANANAADGCGKVVQFMFDGLFARDVQ